MHSQSVIIGTFLLFASTLALVPAAAADTATSTAKEGRVANRRIVLAIKKSE